MKQRYASCILWFYLALFFEHSSVQAVFTRVYLDVCLPRRLKLQRASYRVTQHLNFTWRCKSGYARPYGMRRFWTCDSEQLSKDIDYRQDYIIDPKIYFNPFECIKKTYPKSAWLEGHINLVNKSNPRFCLKDWDNFLAPSANRWRQVVTKIVSIKGVRFTLNKKPSRLDCIVRYDNRTDVLSKAMLAIYFTMSFDHPDENTDFKSSGVLEGARDYLNSTLTSLLDELKTNRKDFDTEETDIISIDDVFYAGECRTINAKIEDDEIKFSSRLPICRVCSKGWFYNATTNRCEGCAHGSYSPESGMTSCRQCPNLLTDEMRDTTSIADCYQYTPGSAGEEFTRAMGEGFLYFILLNAIFAMIMTWSVKKQIRLYFQ